MERNLFKALSIATLCGFMLAFASCANEDITQKKTDTDNNNDKNLTTFVTGTEPESRTSMDYNSGAFFWEAGDYIYVKDDDGIWQKSSNAPTAKTASFRFRVPGKFTNNTTYKVYYPGKYGNKDQVTIPAAQTQTEPNTTAHFGESGDCGTADATGPIGGGTFNFKLNHQAAYLVFQPYTSNSILKKCYLTKVEVSSDNDISSTYTLDPTTGELTGTGSGKQIVLTTKDPTYGSANYNGFPLTNNSPSVETNGALMVIKPGMHTFTIRYWIQDIATNVKGTITKTLTSHKFDKNKYYNMTADLNVHDYDGYHYYCWDAKHNYWHKHEWDTADPWQPTFNYQSNSTYPQLPDYLLDRHWNDSDPGYGVRNDAQTAHFKILPNVNEMTWYVMKGDPRGDTDELWTTMGHLYKGGVWFLKKAYISDYSTEHDVDGNDGRSLFISMKNENFVPGLPAASERNKYFFLPMLGQYVWGQLKGIGRYGYYWSSTGYPSHAQLAYNLQFTTSYATVFYTVPGERYCGLRVQPFE